MIAGDENVLRLDVAVNDTLLVCIAQCIGDFAKNLRCFLDRKLTNASESRSKIFPADERHRIVEQRSSGSCCQQRHDVRMLKTRSKLNLAAKPIDIDARGEVGGKNLDDNLPVELRIRRNEHARHSCAAKLTIYAVGGPDYFL